MAMEIWLKLLKAAEAELEKGNTENAKQIAQPFLVDENIQAKLMAHDVVSRALLRDKDFTGAVEKLKALVDLAPTVKNYMTLLAGYQHSKNLVKYKQTFITVFQLSEKETNSEFTPINILFYYLDGLIFLEDYQEAGKTIDEINLIYRSIKTLESETLFAAGVPFYNDFLALVSKYFRQQDMETNFQNWLKSQLDWVDEYGKTQIQNYQRSELH